MNKKGFTLIEVLVVITIIGILTAIAIPAAQGINKKISQKLYNSKITLATEGAKVWGEDHKKCFTCSGASCSSECVEDLYCDPTLDFENEKICEITIEVLAKNKYIKYDDEANEKIVDPRNKNNLLNDKKIIIVYNKNYKTVNTGYDYYSLSFDGNGATSGEIKPKNCKVDTLCSIFSNNTFERTNYDFAGWSLTSNGSVEYENKDSIKLSADTTLYAVWNSKKYTLSFDGDGSTSGTMDSKKCEHDKACTISNNVFVKTGFKFIGWSITPKGKVLYNNLSSITITKNTVLYAIWQEATPPTILITNTNTLLSGTDIYSSPASIKISATDNLSGIKSIKYCTTTASTCTPTTNISNGSNISVTGSTTTVLGNTICAIATDNLGNTMTTPTCETYKIDNRNPSITCSSTGNWSNTSSHVDCTGTDYFGIRKLEWSFYSNNWNTFSTINVSGPFSTPYNAGFNTSKYQNYVKATDTAGRTYTTNAYSKIDTLTPFPPALDIYGIINDTNSNISNVTCTNNKYLNDRSNNPNYNKNVNTICRLTYINYYNSYTWSWYWEDDWNADSGYSGISHLTYNGSCSSNYYTGGNVPCLRISSGCYADFYAVDAAGNKSLTYLRIYAP